MFLQLPNQSQFKAQEHEMSANSKPRYGRIGFDKFNVLSVLHNNKSPKTAIAETEASNRLVAVKVVGKELLFGTDEVAGAMYDKNVHLEVSH